MEVSQLQRLSDRVDQLLKRLHESEAENRRLRQQQEDWQRDRQNLLQKNDLARTRVEAMITRLKAMERN